MIELLGSSFGGYCSHHGDAESIRKARLACLRKIACSAKSNSYPWKGDLSWSGAPMYISSSDTPIEGTESAAKVNLGLLEILYPPVPEFLQDQCGMVCASVECRLDALHGMIMCVRQLNLS
jgi:hypothetical protein